jgi:TolB-like protein/Flp pilus assembly protein TadD
MSLLAELKRRNVLRVLFAYLAGSWLLLQIADVVLPRLGVPDRVLTILIIVVAIGFVPALVISWAFEWTADGLKRDADVAAGESIAPQTGKTLDRIIFVVLTLAVGFFAVDKFVLDPARDVAREDAAEQRGRIDALIESYGDKSIVVLPFVNMSSDPEQDYFSDGISEEILNLLTKIRELRVISRSTAFAYRGDVHIPTVAEELDVAYVLEGSVRMAGNTVRITAQLIDARVDAHVWSETWDRELVDVFEIQDDVAQNVADQLQLQLLGQRPDSQKVDPDLYIEYLQLKNAIGGSRATAQIIRRLERLVELAPDYVPAIVLLSNAYYYSSGNWANALYDPVQGHELAAAMNRRALAIEPDHAPANAYFGWINAIMNKDLGTAALHLHRAFELEPGNAEVLWLVSIFARAIGNFEHAARLGEMSVARDPACSVCYRDLALAYKQGGNYERAEWAYRERMRLSPGGWIAVGFTLLLQGKYEEALDAMSRPEAENDRFLLYRAMVYHSQGRMSDYNDSVQQLLDGHAEKRPVGMAWMFAWSGDVDRGFEWLEKALAGGYEIQYQYWDPFFENLRQDPRWPEFIKPYWFTEEELAAVEFEPFTD